MAPKMGRMDVDYQVLHDAFFKWQTKPPLSVGLSADPVLLPPSRRWRAGERPGRRRRVASPRAVGVMASVARAHRRGLLRGQGVRGPFEGEATRLPQCVTQSGARHARRRAAAGSSTCRGMVLRRPTRI